MKSFLKKQLLVIILTFSTLGVSAFSSELMIIKAFKNNPAHILCIFVLVIFCISFFITVIVLIKKNSQLKYYKKRILQNEVKFKNFFDKLTDIAFRTDTNGNIIYCNKAAEKATDLPLEKLLNTTFFPLLTDISSEKAAEAFKKVLNGQNITIDLVLNNGKIFQYNCKPEVNSKDEIVGTFGVGRNITEKKKTLQELSDAKEVLESTLNVIPDIIGIQDRDHKIIRYNSAGYSLLNKTHSEVVGKKCYEFIGRSEPCTVCATNKCYSSKKQEHVIKFVEELNAWLDIRAYPILDSDGNIRMIVEHLRDITEQKNMELNLKDRQKNMEKQAKLLDNIFEYSLDSIVLLDKDYNFLRVSKTYARTCQKDIEDLIGKNHFDIYPSSLKKEFDESKEQKSVYQKLERPFTFPDHPEWGTTYWNLGLVPIMDKKSEIELFLFTLKDVTETVKAKEKVESISKFPEENTNPVLRISDNGILLYANPTAKKMILRERKNIGDTVDEVWLKNIKEAFKTTNAKTVEYMFYGKLFLFTLVPVIENKYINLYALDITEHNARKNLLHRAEAHLSSLLDTLPDLVWLKDKAGVYITCNPRFEDFFGAKKNQIIGKTDYDFVDKELADFFRENDRAAMMAERPTINEELITFACDGHKEKLETIKTPMYNKNGVLLGVLGVGRDITERKEMANRLKDINEKLENAHKHAMYMLALASEYKDPETGNHIKRIASMTKELALHLGFTKENAEKIGQSSILHDLGKLGISDYILLKPGRLSTSEFDIMKQHPKIGADIIGDDSWFRDARDIALYHHESWDGNGYPEGLKGEEIPLVARIVSVVDAFDALISRRPYKSAWELEDVVKEIKLEAGNKFDPDIVESFLELVDSGRIKEFFADIIEDEV